MIPEDVAVQRGIECNAMLYNRKRNCPDNKRDIQLRLLYRLALSAPDGAAVECGVFQGGSFVCWASAREGHGALYAVDTWERVEATPEIFRRNVAHYGLDVTVLSMPAHKAANHIEGNVAFCFMDANHKMGILRDIRIWSDKIMPGGILAFHDYVAGGAVHAAVDNWHRLAHWEQVAKIGTFIAFRRPGDIEER